jgi:hypothetical protein
MKRVLGVLAGAVLLSACGSGAQLKTVQNNKSVQQTEAKVQQQVRKCLPSKGGAPDPLLLRHSAERSKFVSCMGIAHHAREFGGCAVGVILGGLPTTTRLEKGLAACVEKVA